MADMTVLIVSALYDAKTTEDYEEQWTMLVSIANHIQNIGLGVSVCVQCSAATSPEALAELIDRWNKSATFVSVLVYGATGLSDLKIGGLEFQTLMVEHGGQDHLVRFKGDTIPVKMSILPRLTVGTLPLATKAAISKIKSVAETVG